MRSFKLSPSTSHASRAGFGYVELLVVITIIGIFAALAIPTMSGIFGKADSAKAKRNALNLVSTFNAARAAGNSMSFADRAEAIAALTTSPGINGSGAYATSHFYVPMAAPELTEATARIAPNLMGSATDGSLTMVP